SVEAKNRSMYRLGAKTFFIYKMQYVSTAQLMRSLKSLANDLVKGGLEDQALAHAINTMTPIAETNSILFTGTPEALQKIQDLIGKFDIASLAEGPPTGPVNFVVYR